MIPPETRICPYGTSPQECGNLGQLTYTKMNHLVPVFPPKPAPCQINASSFIPPGSFCPALPITAHGITGQQVFTPETWELSPLLPLSSLHPTLSPVDFSYTFLVTCVLPVARNWDPFRPPSPPAPPRGGFAPDCHKPSFSPGGPGVRLDLGEGPTVCLEQRAFTCLLCVQKPPSKQT